MAAGRQLFASKGCANCHGQTATGQSGGPELLTGRWYRTATEIAGAMWNHLSILSDRQAVPRLDQSEMAELITYLYLLQSYR